MCNRAQKLILKKQCSRLYIRHGWYGRALRSYGEFPSADSNRVWRVEKGNERRYTTMLSKQRVSIFDPHKRQVLELAISHPPSMFPLVEPHNAAGPTPQTIVFPRSVGCAGKSWQGLSGKNTRNCAPHTAGMGGCWIDPLCETF